MQLRTLAFCAVAAMSATLVLTVPALAGETGFDSSGTALAADYTGATPAASVIGWTAPAGAAPNSPPGDGGGDGGRNAIIAYARQYVGTLNTDSSAGYNNAQYIHFTNDCMNFVSQALKAGGWTNQNPTADWSDPRDWFYYGGNPPVYTRTWSVSSWFARHIEVTGRRSFVRYWSQVQPGDIVLVDWNGKDGDGHPHIIHSAIATTVGASDIYLTYHTHNRLDKSLKALQADPANANAVWWVVSAT